MKEKMVNHVSLNSIATVYNGNSINKKVKQEKYTSNVPGWNFIATKDVKPDGTVEYKNGIVIPFSEDRFKRAPAGSVFVCAEGGSAGKKTAYISEEVCFGNKLYAIASKKDAFIGKYLYYYTRTNHFYAQFQSLMSGIIGGVSAKNFGKIIIPLHPLPEQERIVAKLDELFSDLDTAEAELKQAKARLEVYKKSIINTAFSSCQNTAKIKDLCSIVTDGDHMPPPKSTNGIPFIMISDIVSNKIDFSNTCHVSMQYFSEIGEKRTPKRGDVLYTVTGSFGIPVLVDFDKEFCFQRHIALLRPNGKVEQHYLYYALQTVDVYLQATKQATGTAQKTVGLAVLRNLTIPFVADKKEQNNIVLKIENYLSYYTFKKSKLDEALRLKSLLCQSVLKRAFEGKL